MAERRKKNTTTYGTPVDSKNKEDVATKSPWKRKKTQGQGSSSGKAQDIQKRKRRQKRKKNESKLPQKEDIKSQKTEKDTIEIVETEVNQIQEDTPLETQRSGSQAETSCFQPQKDASKQETEHSGVQHHSNTKMVEAQTQTRKNAGKDKITQTPIIHQNTQETQTEAADFMVPKQNERTEKSPAEQGNESEKTQTHENESAETQFKQEDQMLNVQLRENNPVKTQPMQSDSRPCGDADDKNASSSCHVEQNANLKEEEKTKEKHPSGGISDESQDGRSSEPKSYATVASGEGESEKQSSVPEGKQENKTRSSSTDRGDQILVKPPPGVPVFTFHIYTVLDKKFRFNPHLDRLVLFHSGGYLPLQMTHFAGLKKEGYLVEATLFIEESCLMRGSWLSYSYGVIQRKKQIFETATRHIFIPLEPYKEFHLYECHIDRFEAASTIQSVWQTGLSMVGWRKQKGVEISEAWQVSACTLLHRIFQAWSPSHKQSTENLCEKLKHFMACLGSAHERMNYPDRSHPPVVKVSELISEYLIDILKGESKGNSSETWRRSSPFVLGLSVFMVSRNCNIDLGVNGWAELCHLVSSDSAMDKKNVEGMLSALPNVQHTVLGLMNLCAQQTIPELVLLVPLLLRLRQPGADASRVGPTVEEENWSGLNKVQFSRFRENIRSFPDKRKRMLTLIQKLLPVAEEMPLVLISWLSLVASEDLTDFSDLTEIHTEHLIQTLLYRVRECGETMNNNRTEENVKHTQNILTHILLKVDKEKERMIECGKIKQAFLSSISVAISTCRMVQLVPWYQAAVSSYQLVLKLAETVDAVLGKESQDEKFEARKEQLLEKLCNVQQGINEWRDKLLKNPLLTPSKYLSYPKEIEMWDALLKVECSVQEVSSQWRLRLEKDLKKRICTASEVDRVLVSCVESSMVPITKSHDIIQSCFYEQCHSAIKSICQVH
ncbi:hypothetical protein LDENG_00019240 [Lucifuga dentata]|nr:hypothetical protein LDENG_00019240 [Lucifuga dentata]